MPSTTPMTDEALDAFGVYVGPTTREELLRSLSDHTCGTLLVHLNAPDGSPLLHTYGDLYPAGLYDPARRGEWDAESEDHYLIGGEEYVPDGKFPIGHRDAKARLHVPTDVTVEQYTGGFRVVLPGGAVLTVVIWHDVLHVTDSRDVAPGLPPGRDDHRARRRRGGRRRFLAERAWAPTAPARTACFRPAHSCAARSVTSW
jgi:hypothetical protein